MTTTPTPKRKGVWKTGTRRKRYFRLLVEYSDSQYVFNDWLQISLANLGLSVQRLSRLIDLPIHALRSIHRGKYPPFQNVLIDLANTLGYYICLVPKEEVEAQREAFIVLTYVPVEPPPVTVHDDDARSDSVESS